jgi:hypothetical protein
MEPPNLTSADAKPARLISPLAPNATEILLEVEPGMIYYHTGGDEDGGFENRDNTGKRHAKTP